MESFYSSAGVALIIFAVLTGLGFMIHGGFNITITHKEK